VVFAKLFVLLPYRWQMKAGIGLARLVYPFLKRRKVIAMTNIQIMFPELTQLEQEKICRQCFDSMGAAAVENIIAWFMSKRRFAKIDFTFHGVEAFKASHENPQQGTLMLGCHYTAIEIAGRYISENFPPIYLVYQRNRHKVFEYVSRKQRHKYVEECFTRKNLLPIVRVLRNKQTLWYAPDQDFGQEHTIFVPFFDIPCSTLTATSWLVQKSKARVFPVYQLRRDDLSGYDLYADEPWDNFPSGDVYQDALRYNQWLESVIKRHPAQYLLQHRRFKTRPVGDERIY
jgi:lipid A biosynthesis lauroyl/palmitoleoyl acyltransferase